MPPIRTGATTIASCCKTATARCCHSRLFFAARLVYRRLDAYDASASALARKGHTIVVSVD
jgi:hypothetical protein